MKPYLFNRVLAEGENPLGRGCRGVVGVLLLMAMQLQINVVALKKQSMWRESHGTTFSEKTTLWNVASKLRVRVGVEISFVSEYYIGSREVCFLGIMSFTYERPVPARLVIYMLLPHFSTLTQYRLFAHSLAHSMLIAT